MESGYRIAPVAWDTPEFAAAAAIRFRVFVDEQGTPADEEVDEHDAAAWHVLAVDAAGNPCGTGRLFAEDAGTARIGRMAVARDHRRNGCGTAIMRSVSDITLLNTGAATVPPKYCPAEGSSIMTATMKRGLLAGAMPIKEAM